MRLIEVIQTFPADQYIDVIIVESPVQYTNKKLTDKDMTTMVYSGLVKDKDATKFPLDKYLSYSVIKLFSEVSFDFIEDVNYITVVIERNY